MAKNSSPGSPEKWLEESGVRGGVIACVDVDVRELGEGANDRFFVHGLMSDAPEAEAINQSLREAGRLGDARVEFHEGNRLPYSDNLINLLISARPIDEPEILRVLVPRGVAYLKEKTGPWKKIVKPSDPETDEWTHFLHDATNNAVARDEKVAPPRHLQWVSGPLWLRSHETPSGFQAMVTGAGRVFYILDEGVIGVTDPRLPDRWSIVARDAHNGRLLWKRELGEYGWREWAKDWWEGNDWTTVRAGRTKVPEDNQQRLVIAGDRLFATLRFNAPLSVLDAATGEVIRTVAGAENTRGIYAVPGFVVARCEEKLVVLDDRTWKILWSQDTPPQHIAVSGGRLIGVTGAEIAAFDLKDGEKIWRTKHQLKGLKTMVAHENAVLALSGGVLLALDPENGRERWRSQLPPRSGFEGNDLFVIDGRAWVGVTSTDANGEPIGKGDSAYAEGRDLLTGEVTRKVLAKQLRSPEHHHRCYRNKATDRYLITSLEGAEFLDLDGENHLQQNWVRGACRLGMMPANGMLYVPPDQCFCSPGAKLLGLTALGGAEGVEPAPDDARLVRGPAYGTVKCAADPDPESWPTLRKDAARHGSSPTVVEGTETSWTADLGGDLTAPVAAGGRVFVVRKDNQTLYALDRASGEIAWTFTVLADSPPTVCGDALLIGSRDGRVHCLRADDGARVWSFLAAPADRRIGAFDRIESIWPVHGSVLVDDGVAYVTAGRSTYLDGGIFLSALDVRTGERLHTGRIEGPNYPAGERGLAFFSEGANNDVLVLEGDHLYMRQKKFTRELVEVPAPILSSKGAQDVGKHLFATAGLLDGSWYNRTFWMYSARWPGFQLANQAPKAGQILSIDDQKTYALRVFYRRNCHSPMFFPGKEGYLVFADKNSTEPQIYGEEGSREPLAWLPQSAYYRVSIKAGAANPEKDAAEATANPEKNKKKSTVVPLDQEAFGEDKGIGYTRADPPVWANYLPVRARGMVKTGNALFLAGQIDRFDENDPLAAFEGRTPSKLVTLDPGSGKQRAETDLTAPPVFDGLIVANGALFVAQTDGKVVCLK